MINLKILSVVIFLMVTFFDLMLTLDIINLVSSDAIYPSLYARCNFLVASLCINALRQRAIVSMLYRRLYCEKKKIFLSIRIL